MDTAEQIMNMTEREMRAVLLSSPARYTGPGMPSRRKIWPSWP